MIPFHSIKSSLFDLGRFTSTWFGRRIFNRGVEGVIPELWRAGSCSRSLFHGAAPVQLPEPGNALEMLWERFSLKIHTEPKCSLDNFLFLMQDSYPAAINPTAVNLLSLSPETAALLCGSSLPCSWITNQDPPDCIFQKESGLAPCSSSGGFFFGR